MLWVFQGLDFPELIANGLQNLIFANSFAPIDGKMKNCLFATSETDLLTPLRNGEKIDQTILEAIKSKKHSRDGMDVKMDAEHYEQNRSMISIGG